MNIQNDRSRAAANELAPKLHRDAPSRLDIPLGAPEPRSDAPSRLDIPDIPLGAPEPRSDAPSRLDIPLGVPEPRGPGAVERLLSQWLTGGPRTVILILLGGLMIAGGLADAVNEIVFCWNFEPPGADWPRCHVGFGWHRHFGPYLSGVGTFGPALVFFGTTLFAVTYALKLKLKLKTEYRRETTES